CPLRTAMAVKRSLPPHLPAPFFTMSIVRNRGRRRFVLSAVLLVFLSTLIRPAAAQSNASTPQPSTVLELSDGDKLVIIGNTLAERMQHDGYFETNLHARFPTKRLSVRNLGWSADEIDLRPRSANFQDHGHNLSDHAPQVVLAMFGFNESFAGPAGLDAFRTRFEKFLSDTQAEIGDAARLVVCSPIPHENLHRRALPDGKSTNANLQIYSDVMRELCD